MTGLIGKLIAYSLVYPEVVILRAIRPTMGFDTNNNPTGEQVGYTLTVVEIKDFKTLKIKIPNGKLPITVEELELTKKEGKNVFIKIIDGTVKPYYSSSSKTIEDSISAKGFQVVEGKLQ